MFTSGRPEFSETPRPAPAGSSAARREPAPSHAQSSRGDVSDQEQDRRARGRRAARARPRRVRHSSKSSSSSSSTSSVLSGASGDDLRRRLDVRRAGLRAVGLVAVRPDRQLPGRRLGRGHHRARVQDRRLRRQRPAAEARRRSSDRQERQPGGPDPDVPGRDHRLLQPAGRADRPEARRQDDRRHLPRQDQDLERPGDQGAEPGRHPAEHGDHRDPPLGLLGHDRRLHRLPGRGRPRMQEQGRRRQGRAVADRHRREGQRRRGRRGPADGRRGRLRRAGLRAAAQLHLRRR